MCTHTWEVGIGKVYYNIQAKYLAKPDLVRLTVTYLVWDEGRNAAVEGVQFVAADTLELVVIGEHVDDVRVPALEKEKNV